MIPLSTYRLQLNRDFDLRAAIDLVPYLGALGVDWLYLSPIFAAQPGSMHGYDVIDPTVVNPELGGRAALDALSRCVHDEGMRILLDIVPNHEAATEANRRWQEALRTRTPGWFDVDWPAPDGPPRYRRFFDVSGLVGVRVEDECVFRASHALVFELLEQGIVDGLRVDHVDGLVDPAEYLERLRAEVGDVFLVVEKILTRDEALPSWPVDGTTGYEAGDALTALAIDPTGRDDLVAALLAQNGGVPFGEVERASKAYALDRLFGPEWARLRDLLADDTQVAALREVTLALDVYRTYGDGAEDEVRFTRASAALDPDTAEVLRRRLVTGTPDELATRWRQLSGPVMAKGHEDTACYRFPALLAQNDVGGDPGADPRDAVARFHRLAGEYRGLIGTSTHDSKRSEDVRARLCVVSERSGDFKSGFRRWRELVAPEPDVTQVELRFVAQTLLGVWPLADDLDGFENRIGEYLTKALREAKEQTNWVEPDVAHEQRVVACARRSIDAEGRLFYDAFGRLVDDVMFFGALNSLALLTLKLAMPGTPDIYRGCELWDFSLVDPDNRRPVDFAARARMLGSLAGRRPDDLLRDWRSGAIKLHVTTTGLRARRDNPELFRRGDYVPLAAPPGVFAFARHLHDAWAIAVVPRLATRRTTAGRWPLGSATWGDAVLVVPDVRRTEIRLAEALGELPVALIVLP